MKSSFDSIATPPAFSAQKHCTMDRARHRVVLCAMAGLLAATCAAAQVVTIDTHGNARTGPGSAPVDRRYSQIQPTHVTLTQSELDAKTRLELIRVMQSEQGFAMRPFPRGHKGLTLVANGKLEPAGEAYLAMATEQGLCAKPGDRLVLSDVKFEKNKIVFDLNGGPDPKHRFLRHIQIGTGAGTNPVVQDNGQEAMGARLTLAFQNHVPELTGGDVKALLSPLISFDLKTPIQAFTDTLPPKLKEAILNHHVMVGMSTDMVLFAMGSPQSKSREIEGQMPFEEWIYGQPPKDVQFVRINGNRVIRVEVAKMGETPQIFTNDEVAGLMRTDGTPLIPDKTTRTVAMGDAERDPNTQAPTAPPSLRKPGETLPQNDPKENTGVMRPVQFPKPKPTEDSAGQTGATPAPAAEPAKPQTDTPEDAHPAPSSSSQQHTGSN